MTQEKNKQFYLEPIENVNDQVLKLFIGDDEMRDWMSRPFTIENKVMATNAYNLVMIDKKYVSKFPDIEISATKVLSIIPGKRNQNITISTKELMELIEEKVEQVEAFEECAECEGYGEVDWEFNGFTKPDDCPECEGSGDSDVSIGDVFNPDCTFIIGKYEFRMKQMLLLIKVSNLIGKDIVLVYQEEEKDKSIFRIGDFEILVMPSAEPGKQIIDLKLPTAQD